MTNRILKWRVEQKEEGLKLQLFLQQKLASDFSLRRVKKLIDFGRCKVNGRIERFAATPLKAGNWVEFIEDGTETSLGKIPEKVSILYEDEDLLLCDKPAGHPTDGLLGVDRWLAPHCSSPLFPVHRLDRDTTGVLLLAKNSEMRDLLMALFRERKVRKSYLAIVDGIPSEASGCVENYLERRFAKTLWTLECQGHGIALLRCLPETGRTHQIRLHLAGLGLPILGDATYCRQFKSPYPAVRQLLHAEQVAFIHPSTGRLMTVKAPIPADLADALKYMK